MRLVKTLGTALLALAGIISTNEVLVSQQPTSDIPKSFVAPTAGYDYVKREVMIPMRDGVKLYTVIVVPKGAKNAPILLTRTPYNASGRAARNTVRTCSRRCRRATRCSSPTATSACSRTCAASTGPRAIT